MERKEKRKAREKKTEIRGYLKAAFLGMIVGVVVVFASMAMKVAAAPVNTQAKSPAAEEKKPEVRNVTEEKTAKTGNAQRTENKVKAGTVQEKESIPAENKEEAKEEAAQTEPEQPEEPETVEEQKIMYLTFDDGPSAQNTDKVLDVLKEKNIKATFFVIGEYVRKYPETAKRIVAEGHTIGIHCDVHDYGPLYASVDSYIEDFEKAYETVLEVTGVEAKLFRFPGGSVNAYNKAVRDDIIAEMEKRGFIYYDWNASLEDASSKVKTPEELVQNAVDTALGRKKVVLLAHDRVENTALALEALIDAFPEYKMEPLTEDVAPVQF